MSNDLSAKYYQNSKERVQKRLVKNIKVFLKKKEKRQYVPKDEKQKIVEYSKKYCKMRKSASL